MALNFKQLDCLFFELQCFQVAGELLVRGFKFFQLLLFLLQLRNFLFQVVDYFTLFRGVPIFIYVFFGRQAALDLRSVLESRLLQLSYLLLEISDEFVLFGLNWVSAGLFGNDGFRFRLNLTVLDLSFLSECLTILLNQICCFFF